MKRVKFANAQEAQEVMSSLHARGVITGWSDTRSGYVRYHDPIARVWRDLTHYDLQRWA